MGTWISFVWMSILEARELLEKGLRWTVGDGEDVFV